MEMNNQELMKHLIEQFQEILPEQQIKPEPETSTQELLAFEKAFKINTSDLIDTNTDTSHIPEEIIEKWQIAFRTFKIMKGSMDNINSIKKAIKREYLENSSQKANPKGFAFIFFYKYFLFLNLNLDGKAF